MSQLARKATPAIANTTTATTITLTAMPVYPIAKLSAETAATGGGHYATAVVMSNRGVSGAKSWPFLRCPAAAPKATGCMNDQRELSDPMALDQTVVLVGLMGAGKSCIGRRLAQALSVPFVDADSEIEKAAGLSVAEIFAKYGEPYFRDGERRVMSRLLLEGPSVLATGGGAFMDPETRRLIKDRSVSVWLRADLETLNARTKGRSHRPLLNQGDPRETLAQLMTVRYPVYAEADITVDTGPDNPNVTTAAVIRALEHRFGRPLATVA